MMIANDELTGMWTEVYVASFKVLFHNIYGMTKKNNERRQFCRYPNRDRTRDLPNTNVGVLTTPAGPSAYSQSVCVTQWSAGWHYFLLGLELFVSQIHCAGRKEGLHGLAHLSCVSSSVVVAACFEARKLK